MPVIIEERQNVTRSSPQFCMRVVGTTAGRVRVLATNLDAAHFDAALFGDLEAFKRLKHRLHLEAVSGLSQQALIIDVAAKVIADNITSLMCAAAAQHADLPARSRKCNRSYAAGLMQRVLPRLVLLIGDIAEAVGIPCGCWQELPSASCPDALNPVQHIASNLGGLACNRWSPH